MTTTILQVVEVAAPYIYILLQKWKFIKYEDILEPVLEKESDLERYKENYINETDPDDAVKMTQAPTEEYKQVVAATENIQIMTTQEIINQSTQQVHFHCL